MNKSIYYVLTEIKLTSVLAKDPKKMNARSRLQNFKGIIMRLLPPEWVTSFDAYEALEFLSLDDFIGRTHRLRTSEQNRRIMELCIKTSKPEDWSIYGNTPIAILSELKRFSTQWGIFPIYQQFIAKFDGKLYALARSNECHDSERILTLFCTRPARIIQFAWKRYWHNRSARVIQQRVLEWLYRPNGPFMKKSEASFYIKAGQ